MKTNKPYEETKNGDLIKRTFTTDVVSEELSWHRDREDRIVKVISETDWLFQFDEQLPIRLYKNQELRIPKNTFHRVIKGKTDLVVEIMETNF